MSGKNQELDPWYIDNLVCPRTNTPLSFINGHLVSQNGNAYPVVDGIPIMLLDTEEQTIKIANNSIKRAKGIMLDSRCPDFYLESLGISESEKAMLVELVRGGNAIIDPVVSVIIGATNGNMYKHLIGKLSEYPIPNIPIQDANGEWYLDVGCNWGRWCIAAARKGYQCVGIDPSLGAIMAARRVTNQLQLPIKYLVADGRYLPFKRHSFNIVYSYSVFQHLCKDHVQLCLKQINNVLKPRGRSIVQMPNCLGITNLINQAKRGFREARNFEVRYWSLRKLKKTFGSLVGPTNFSVDGYFGLGMQETDMRLMTPVKQMILMISIMLKKLNGKLPALLTFADSVFVISAKRNVD